MYPSSIAMSVTGELASLYSLSRADGQQLELDVPFSGFELMLLGLARQIHDRWKFDPQDETTVIPSHLKYNVNGIKFPWGNRLNSRDKVALDLQHNLMLITKLRECFKFREPLNAELVLLESVFGLILEGDEEIQ